MSALSRVQGFHKASYSHMETCIAKDFDVTEVQEFRSVVKRVAKHLSLNSQ